ncbi:MAG: hypothetical protein GY869_32430, partial [Planctomycetes bacterium]|nr:hypothetical protein [Planctomycetota bacterium]
MTPLKNFTNRLQIANTNFIGLLILAVAIIGFFPTVSQAQLFGTGAHGTTTIYGTLSMSSDVNFIHLTVANTGVIETHGYTIYVSGTLNNSGTITDSWSGGDGGDGGTAGIGGYGVGMHTPPTAGGDGLAGGSASVSGGGNGGSGGGGGG